MSTIETLLRNAFIVSGNDKCGAYLGDMSAKVALAEFLALRAENERLREALTELRGYAQSVWFDEANATDEEHEIMARARAALSGETRAKVSESPESPANAR